MLSLLDLLLFSTCYEFAIKHEHQTRKWEHDKEFKPEDYDEVFLGFPVVSGKTPMFILQKLEEEKHALD